MFGASPRPVKEQRKRKVYEQRKTAMVSWSKLKWMAEFSRQPVVFMVLEYAVIENTIKLSTGKAPQKPSHHVYSAKMWLAYEGGDVKKYK